MKKRYIYLLLFGIPGFFVALIIAVVVFGVVAGAFWIFIFGDNTWSSSIGVILPFLLALTFLVTWIAIIVIGFTIGKRLEKDPQLNKKHIFISAGLTLLFILIILIQQLSIGNLGSKPDSLVCSDYCVLNGYSSSGLPPLDSGDRTCTCYDNFANEAIKIPLNKIPLDNSE